MCGSIGVSHRSESPILVNTLQCPFELLSKSFGEESFDGAIELFAEDHGESRVNVVLTTY